MTINYGKRNPGALTASSPGDTLYIPLEFFNDSGASISIGSALAVTDIELFKNGGVAQRATDSGYAILGDTGNFDDRIGFKGISVSLFNTADDTGFYDAGSSYWVAIDNVTVDARTVRFWPAVFEIGTPRANIVEVDSDTGAAAHLQQLVAGGFADTGINDRLAKILADTDTGIQSSVNMTQIAGDTGAAAHIAHMADEYDTGSLKADVSGILDTGTIVDAVWGTATSGHITSGTFGRELQLAGAILLDTTITGTPSSTSFQLSSGSTTDNFYNDQLFVITSGTGTGQARLIKSYVGSTKTITIDEAFITTPASGAGIAIRAIHAHALTQIVDAIWDEADTGHSDTGTFGRLSPRLSKVAADTDTGIQSSVNVTSFTDTGVNNRLAVILADTDTGIQSSVNVTSFADTGVNNRLAVILADTDTGLKTGLSVSVSAISDTGVNERLAAIETKTNSLTFTTANQVDANVQSVNDVPVAGTGASTDRWRPA